MYRTIEEIIEEREQKNLEKKKKRERQVRGYYIGFAALVIVGIAAFIGNKPETGAPVKAEAGVKYKAEAFTMPYIEPEIDIKMIGDVLLHEAVQKSGMLDDGSYNYDHLFANVKADIENADMAIVNQEVILGGKELGLSGYPTFNGPYEVGDALVNAGFDVVLHASNHAMDKGKTGILNCLNFWKTKHSDTAVLGIYDSKETYDNNLYVYEKNGMKVAVLNYTYGVNGIHLPADMPYAVAMLEETKVRADLEKARATADFIVVCPQWGSDDSHAISAAQKQWTDIFLQEGVDLVIGTHTHYIQPVQMLTDGNGNQMLVYYSLGNFVNATGESGSGIADRMVGAMAEVTIAKKENGEIYIKEYGVEPLVTHLLYGKQQLTTYKLADYTAEMAGQNEAAKKDAAFNLDYCKKLCESILGELY